MATKNLVPRQDNEGKLGLPTRRWAGINAVLGSLDKMKTDELLNKQGSPLIAAGENITITINPDDSPAGSQYVISSSASGSSEVDRIFEGAEGVQTSVETINTTDPLENKISFSISGNELWNINSQGHFVPRTNTLNLGLSSSPIRNIYLLQDGLNLGSSNLRIDNASKNLQIGTLVNESLVYEDVTTSLEDVKFATTEPIDLTTALVNGLEIDGQLLTTGDRVLVKDQVIPSENGVYVVSAVEGPAVRANDLIATSDFSGIRVAVLKGDSNTQKIFFTVPHTDGSSKTATSNMKWVKLGSGGLEAVEDDPAPVLGGDLNVNGNSIQGTTITLKALNNDPNSIAGLTLNSQLGNTNLTINSHTDGPSSLNFATPSNSKFLKIESVTDTFFTSNNIPSTFTYKFNEPTQDEINTTTAYFATQSWVSGQGFLTSTSLDSYVTDDEITDFITAADLPNLTNYIQTNDNASLTSLTLAAQPQNDDEAANKQYVDLVVQGLREVLQPVRFATTTNINLADQLENNDLIDGVNVSTGDRILVREQDDPRDNGIYIVQASGAAVRSSDFELNDEVSAKFVFVEGGNTYAQSGFICTSPETDDTVGTHDILFAKFSAAGQTEAGAALSKTGNVFDVKADGTSIEVDASTNSLKIKDVAASLLSGTISVDRLPDDIPVSKISGDIVASSVDENAINPADIDTVLNSIADGDLFIVRDVSADPDDDSTPEGATTKATASVLKNYIRTDITNSIGQVGFSVVDDNGVQKLSSELTSKAISEQTLYDADPNEDGTLSDNDTFLVYDESSTLLKQVSYSNIKSGSVLDISSYDNLDASDVTNNDQLLIRNSGDDLHKSVTVRTLKEVFSGSLDYVPVTTGGTIPDIKANTHYHIKDNAGDTSLFYFVLPVSDDISEGDIIKISMSFSESLNNSSEQNQNERAYTNYLKSNVRVVLGPTDLTINYNSKDFHSPKEFIFDGTRWFASVLDQKDFYSHSYLTFASNKTEFSDLSSWRSNPVVCFKYGPNSIESVDIPTAQSAYESGFKNGDKKTFYFADNRLEKLIIDSSENDIMIRGRGTLANFATNSFTNQKIINFSGVGIKKVVITFFTERNDKHFWLIENYIDEVNDVELPDAISAVEGDANKVLKFIENSNNEIVLSKGLVQSVNIGNDAILAGTTGADRIIQNNAIKKSKLEKITPNRVLGYVGTATEAQNIGEVKVLDDLNQVIEDSDKHTHLATVEAIKQYVKDNVALFSSSSSDGLYKIIDFTTQDAIFTTESYSIEPSDFNGDNAYVAIKSDYSSIFRSYDIGSEEVITWNDFLERSRNVNASQNGSWRIFPSIKYGMNCLELPRLSSVYGKYITLYAISNINTAKVEQIINQFQFDVAPITGERRMASMHAPAMPRITLNRNEILPNQRIEQGQQYGYEVYRPITTQQYFPFNQETLDVVGYFSNIKDLSGDLDYLFSMPIIPADYDPSWSGNTQKLNLTARYFYGVNAFIYENSQVVNQASDSDNLPTVNGFTIQSDPNKIITNTPFNNWGWPVDRNLNSGQTDDQFLYNRSDIKRSEISEKCYVFKLYANPVTKCWEFQKFGNDSYYMLQNIPDQLKQSL